jgi:hypothetical protein
MKSCEYGRSLPNIDLCQLQSAYFRGKLTKRLQALLERVFDENERMSGPNLLSYSTSVILRGANLTWGIPLSTREYKAC